MKGPVRGCLAAALALGAWLATSPARAQDAGVRCGDGICSRGETCRACPVDCGLCGPPDAASACGDGICSRGETCGACPTDCGLCAADAGLGDASLLDAGARDAELTDVAAGVDGARCLEVPTAAPATATSLRWSVAPVELRGTGVRASVDAVLRATANATREQCIVEASLEGGGEVCGAVLGERACAPMRVTGGGTCAFPIVCDRPPIARCDDGRACCERRVSADARASHAWTRAASVGLLACDFTLTGSVTAALAGTLRTGAACAPCANETVLEGRVALDARGTATCGLRALGFDANASMRAEACATRDVAARIGCGTAVEPVGGASFTVHVAPMEFGWFSVGAFGRRWETGHGC